VSVCAGVDGCKGGWIAVWRGQGLPAEARVFKRFGQVAGSLPDDAVIAVDIPIGLPDQIDGPGRAAEQAVRPMLRRKSSSIFSVPSRQAVGQGMKHYEAWLSGVMGYRQAYVLTKQAALATSDPSRAISRQAFGILPKIGEVDQLLRADKRLADRVWESHPEVAFCVLNGGIPLLKNKLTEQGSSERRGTLISNGFASGFLSQAAPYGAKPDDFLDACAMLLVAEAIRAKKHVSHPPDFGHDRHGLRIAITTTG
jgi:predicted RNase H-like nuclease